MGLTLKKPVIVTALFDIGREDWNVFTMSYDAYLHWMRNMLEIDSEMVIFTEEKMFKRIFDMRSVIDPKMDKTKIIVQEIKDFPAYRLFYTRLENLMETPSFIGKTSFNVPEMTRPLYNVLMFNKMYWLRHVRDMRFFENDSTVWVDAGCYRDDKINLHGRVWPTPNKINDDRITFFSHHHNISIDDTEQHALSQMRFIHGTCFAVPNICLDTFIDEVEETIDTSIKNGYIGSDEKMFDITYLKNPSAYTLIKCSWREYFPFFL